MWVDMSDFLCNIRRGFVNREFSKYQSRLLAEYYVSYLNKLGVDPRLSTLDVGCGYGFVSQYFCGAYSGVDLSEQKIEFAQRMYGNKFRVQDVLDYSCAQEIRYQQILLFTVLDEIEDKHQALINISNYLDVEGVLYVEVRNSGFLIGNIISALGLSRRRYSRLKAMGKSEQDLCRDAYVRIFNSSGFDVLKTYKAIRPLPSSSYIQLIKKMVYRMLDFVVPLNGCFMLGFVLRRKVISVGGVE